MFSIRKKPYILENEKITNAGGMQAQSTVRAVGTTLQWLWTDSAQSQLSLLSHHLSVT